jgi:hypothetical protein
MMKLRQIRGLATGRLALMSATMLLGATMLLVISGVHSAHASHSATFLVHIENGGFQSNSSWDMSTHARNEPGESWGYYADWPETMFYYNNASVDKVHSAFGFPPYPGSPMSMSLNPTGFDWDWQWDDRRGTKSTFACGAEETEISPPFGLPGPSFDLHVPGQGRGYHTRVYGGAGGRMGFSLNFGYYVHGTTHIDYNEGCDPSWHGETEAAEQVLRDRIATQRPSWKVHGGWGFLYNNEIPRKHGKHRVNTDGFATYINVP